MIGYAILREGGAGLVCVEAIAQVEAAGEIEGELARCQPIAEIGLGRDESAGEGRLPIGQFGVDPAYLGRADRLQVDDASEDLVAGVDSQKQMAVNDMFSAYRYCYFGSLSCHGLSCRGLAEDGSK